MSETARQVMAIIAFTFLGPLLMITSLNYADVVRSEINEVKEEDDESSD